MKDFNPVEDVLMDTLKSKGTVTLNAQELTEKLQRVEATTARGLLSRIFQLISMDKEELIRTIADTDEFLVVAAQRVSNEMGIHAGEEITEGIQKERHEKVKNLAISYVYNFIELAKYFNPIPVGDGSYIILPQNYIVDDAKTPRRIFHSIDSPGNIVLICLKVLWYRHQSEMETLYK